MRFPSVSRAALGPVLLVSLLILLIFWYRPAPRPRIAPPWALNNPLAGALDDMPEVEVDLPEIDIPPLPSTDDLFTQGETMNIFSAAGIYNQQDHEHLVGELDEALIYTAERFGSLPTQRFTASVKLNEDCGLNGAAFTGQRTIEVYACADIPRWRVVNIMAHEFVHQLAHDYYGPPHLKADMILLEGLATWGAGRYWLSAHPSFRSFVKQYQTNDSLLPLQTSYAGRSINDMNKLYYQWASFVEYLLATYGREKFDALYVTGNKQPGSADYQGIYEKDLATLEQEWLDWLEQE